MSVNSFENYFMSWKPDLSGCDKPLYKALASMLEKDIQTGRLLPGTKLPPQRELADYLEINLSTVAKAFSICSENGLLSSTVGRGTFVAYDAGEHLQREAKIADRMQTDLGLMLSETVSREKIEDLASLTFRLSRTASLDPAAWHMEAARRVLKDCGCVPAEIAIASGSQNALAAVMAGLFKRGDRIGCDPLVYQGLKNAARLFGIRLIPVAQENGEISEEGLRIAAEEKHIRALYVMPDTSNPTMHRMSLSCRQMIARMSFAHGFWVIEDSKDRLLDPGSMPTIQSLAPEQTVFLLSLSKAVNASMRLAYMALPPELLQEVRGALYALDLTQSALLLDMASALIVSGELAVVLEARRADLRKRNALADKVLHGYPLSGGPLSFGRWLPLPEGLSSGMLERSLEKKGVLVYGSGHFAVGHTATEEGLRISVCTPPTLADLERGLQQVREELDYY